MARVLTCLVATLLVGFTTAGAQTSANEAALQEEVKALREQVRQLTQTVEELRARLGEPGPKDQSATTTTIAPEGLLHSWHTDGKLGNGLQLQGGRSNTVKSASDLALETRVAFSVVAWVKSDFGADNTQTQDIMSWWNYPATRSWLLTHHNNGRYLFEIEGKGYVSGGNTSEDWTQVAATYDGSSMRLYINSQLVAELGGLSGTMPRAHAPIVLGGQADGSNGFHGQIDEARIFSRVIAPEELRREYEALAPITSQAEVAEPATYTAIYCVRPGAEGQADGSDWTNAYPSLPERLERGAIYYLAGGEYPSYHADDPVQGRLRITIRKATETEHGPDEGWAPEYGAAQAKFYGSWRFDTPHWLLDGATGGGPGQWREGFGISIHTPAPAGPILDFGGLGVSHCEVRHVALQGGGDDGDAGGNGVANDAIYIGPGSHHITISHFHAWDAGRTILWMRTGPVTLEYGCAGQFESTDGQHAEIASIDGEATIRHCLFTHVEGTGGLIFMGMGPFRVHGNVFAKEPGSDFWVGYNGVIGSWSAKTLVNLTVTNNTFINVPKHVPVFGSLYTRKGQVIARNNAFYNCPNIGGGILTDYSHNHFVNSGGSMKGPHSTRDHGDLTDFIDLETYRPRLASAPGATLEGEYAIDAWEHPRGADGTWDRGAYEYRALVESTADATTTSTD